MTSSDGILHPHLQREPLFDGVVARDGAAHGVVHVVALDLGEEPDVAHVDAEHRRRALADELGRAQDGAVAAEHDRELDVGDRDVDAERRDVAEQRQRSRRARRGRRRRAPAVRRPRAAPSTTRCGGSTVSSRRACATTRMLRSRRRVSWAPRQSVHGAQPFCRIAPAARRARWAMNSALPCVPAIGEETTPQRAEPGVPRRPQHARDGVGAERGIRHEPALDRRAPDLELRLDQQHEVGVRRRRPREPRAARA